MKVYVVCVIVEDSDNDFPTKGCFTSLDKAIKCLVNRICVEERKVNGESNLYYSGTDMIWCEDDIDRPRTLADLTKRRKAIFYREILMAF